MGKYYEASSTKTKKISQDALVIHDISYITMINIRVLI